jgi:hypothetical protein
MGNETTQEVKLVSPQKMSQTVKPEGMLTAVIPASAFRCSNTGD